MKRLCFILLLLVFVINTCSALQNDIELSNYSDKEVIDLLHIVNQELVDRKLVKKAIVPKGTYVVGDDIPAGKYIVSITKEPDFGLKSVYVYDSSDRMVLWENFHGVDDRIVISLESGNVVKFETEVIMFTFTGISFE